LDQWVEPGEQIEILFQNRLDFGELFRQYNESRMLFPKIAFLALANFLKEWNVKAEMLLGLGFSFLMLLIVYLLLSLTNKSFLKNIYILTGYNLLLLSPCSFSRWLRGITLHRLIPDTCILINALIFILNINLRLKIFLYSIFCTIAQYSFSGGIIIWIVSIVFIIGEKNNRRGEKFQNLVVFITSFIISSLFYFQEYKQPSYHPLPSEILNFSFQRIVTYFFSFIGNIFGNSYESSGIIGMCLIISFITLAVIHLTYIREQAIISWIGIGLYTITLGILNSMTRLQLSYTNATRIDYIVHLVYLPLSIIVMFLYLIKSEKDKIQKWVSVGFLVTISILYINKNFQTNFLNNLVIWHHQYSYGKSCIQLINLYQKDDCIKLLFPMSERPYPWKAELVAQRFRELSSLNILKPGIVKKIEISPQGEWGYIDFLQEDKTIGKFKIHGWAKIQNKPADAVVLAYWNDIIDILPTGEPRNDISQIYGWRYLNSGWSGNFVLKNHSSHFNKCDIKAYGFDADQNILYPLKTLCS
jgi:hypothetical protein